MHAAVVRENCDGMLIRGSDMSMNTLTDFVVVRAMRTRGR
jgi:hypothetical protein